MGRNSHEKIFAFRGHGIFVPCGMLCPERGSGGLPEQLVSIRYEGVA